MNDEVDDASNKVIDVIFATIVASGATGKAHPRSRTRARACPCGFQNVADSAVARRSG